jgi:hypothetical protein
MILRRVFLQGKLRGLPIQRQSNKSRAHNFSIVAESIWVEQSIKVNENDQRAAVGH